MFPKFDSYLKAQNACYDTYGQDGYSLHELTKVVIEKNIIFNNYLSTTPVFELGAARTLIGLGLVNTGSSLNVIDFGGGGGAHFIISKKSFGSQLKCNWAVVETTAMVNEAKRRKIETEELKFYDSLIGAKECLGDVDLVFASSSLQYCPNPLSYLKQILDISPKHIYITRTPFLVFESEIISIQTSKLSDNGPGPLPYGFDDKPIFYPITFVSLQAVENLLRENYEVRFLMHEDRRVHQFEEIHIDHFGFFCARKN